MKRFYRPVLAGMAAAVISVCSACGAIPEKNHGGNSGDRKDAADEKTEEITIPASLIKFSSSDLQDNIEAFSDYCTSVRQDGDDMIIEVTTEQKETLIQMHEDNIREVMDDMVEADPSYSCELDEDYSRVVYRYDENIDGILQAKVLLSLTTSYALKGIMETGNPDWHIHAEIVNCHTGAMVVEGTLPDEAINFGPDEWEKSYVSTGEDELQKEIMRETGLPGEYSALTDTQKSAVTSIEDMLTWLEEKYQQKFHYVSYAPGDAIEQEHLKVYPEQGDESDIVTVYRTYENGLYRYEDDYGAILMRPVYEEQVRAFAEQYLPAEGIKIYTEIKNGGSSAADAEPVLNEVSAVTYIFMDDALCSEQYETFLEAVPDWLIENCQGVPAGLYLRMTESEAWLQIDRSDYEDKLREDVYTKEAECAISGNGKVTVY